MIGAFTGGGLSASSSSSVGPRAVDAALKATTNQDNSVFVGGSGRSSQSKPPVGINTQSTNNNLILGGAVLLGVLLLSFSMRK